MSNVSISLEHGGKKYAAEIATIEATTLGIEDHGVWSACLQLAGSSWGQVAGGYCLDRPSTEGGSARRVGTAFGMDHIMAIVETLGCRDWEHVKGQRCLVLREDAYGSIHGIANLTGENVLVVAEHAAQWQLEMTS